MLKKIKLWWISGRPLRELRRSVKYIETGGRRGDLYGRSIFRRFIDAFKYKKSIKHMRDLSRFEEIERKLHEGIPLSDREMNERIVYINSGGRLGGRHSQLLTEQDIEERYEKLMDHSDYKNM